RRAPHNRPIALQAENSKRWKKAKNARTEHTNSCGPCRDIRPNKGDEQTDDEQRIPSSGQRRAPHNRPIALQAENSKCWKKGKNARTEHTNSCRPCRGIRPNKGDEQTEDEQRIPSSGQRRAPPNHPIALQAENSKC